MKKNMYFAKAYSYWDRGAWRDCYNDINEAVDAYLAAHPEAIERDGEPEAFGVAVVISRSGTYWYRVDNGGSDDTMWCSTLNEVRRADEWIDAEWADNA